jgi:amino acid adenylation domain-containing protein
MERFPLTSLQRAMLLASLRAPGRGAYIVQDVCRISEELDAAALKLAWNRLVSRHAALRTVFSFDADGRPWQRVLEAAEPEWAEKHWPQPGQSDRSADQSAGLATDLAAGLATDLAAFLDADRKHGFDFSAGPPCRITLARVPSGHILIWSCHHVLLDGRSFTLLWEEWFRTYHALLRNQAPALPAAPDFRDHLRWLAKQDWNEARRYWREYLAGVEPGCGSVVDRLQPASRASSHSTPGAAASSDAARETFALSAELSAEVHAFAERHRLTINTLLQGAWALLLSRHLGRDAVVFGVVRACRHSSVPDAAGMAGVLINTLPVRIDACPEAEVLPWLKQIRENWVGQRPWEHTPIELVQEASGLVQGEPLFETVLSYDHEPAANRYTRMDGWRNRKMTRLRQTDTPLTLAAHGTPVVHLDLIYDAARFSGIAVRSMAGHVAALIEAFIRHPERQLGALNMLAAGEEAWLIEASQGPQIEYPRGVCAHRLFEEQVRRTPHQIALENEGESVSCGEAVSYAELNRRSNQLAHFLRAKSIGPEDVVAVALERGPSAIVAFLGILKAGAVFLALSPELPEGRQAAILEDARPALVLAEETLAHAAGMPEENLPNTADPSNSANSSNGAYAVYTSGSTGTPKGILVTHRSLVNHTLSAIRTFGLSNADRRFQFAPLGSDVFIAEVLNYMCCGATLVFAPGRHSIHEYSRLLERHRITIAAFTGSWWTEWVAALAAHTLTIPPSLRAVVAGMEQVNPAAFEAWKTISGGRIRWFNAYGPAEATLTSTVYEQGASDWECDAYVPIGTPNANTQVHVLDAQRRRLPAGMAGELYIGGDGVSRGYLNAPGLTSEKFVPDPFGGAGCLYRTGDMGFRLPDGNLVLLGRADRQVKIRGFRVELDEIEAVLARHHGIRQCAVVSPSANSLVAYYVAEGAGHLVPGNELPAHKLAGNELPPGELRRYLSGHLPPYMLPHGFVRLEEMPLTGGKIDRCGLPPWTPVQDREDFMPPATGTEVRLAALWREALGVRLSDANANFFELGGDSLRATRLITLIQREFGKEVALATLFHRPTIAGLAAFLDGDSPHHNDSLPVREDAIAFQSNGSRSPLFCVSAAATDPYRFRNLSEQLGADQPFYAIPLPVQADENVTVEELAKRVCQAVTRARPEGPWVLGGYCFGGAVAFEAARQLISGGGEVRLVALFDSKTPGYPKLRPAKGKYWRQLTERKVRVQELLAHAGALRALLTRKVEGRLLRAGITNLPIAQDNVVRAARLYVPRPLAVRVVQFLAASDHVSAQVLDDPRLGWRDVAQHGFEVHRVSAQHADLLASQAAELAALLERILKPSMPDPPAAECAAAASGSAAGHIPA